MIHARLLPNAPPELIDLYKHAEDLGAKWIDNRVRPQSIAMLGRLISDPRMKEVWQYLFELSCKSFRSANYGMAIFSAAQSALVLLEGPRRSSTDEARLFSEISDLAGELRHRIVEAGVLGPCEVEELMNDDELRDLASLTHTPVQTPTDNIERGSEFESDGFVETRTKTWGIIPALPELLRRLQEVSKARVPSRLWRQPRADSAGRNVFALHISAHVYEQYKTYCDDTVGIFTTVALGLERNSEIEGTLLQQLRLTRSSSQSKSID